MKRRKGREFTEEKLRGIDKGRDKALYSLVGDKDKAKEIQAVIGGLYRYEISQPQLRVRILGMSRRCKYESQ